jgi:hypothetical protein
LTSDATSIWDAVAARDYRGWRGIPASAPYAGLEARFPRLVEMAAPGRLGSAGRPVPYRYHVAYGYPQNLRVWFDGPLVALVQADLPHLAHRTGDLLADLGAPAARLDHRWDVVLVRGGARLYPDRGIAVFTDHASALVRLALFARCPLSEYLARLHMTG